MFMKSDKKLPASTSVGRRTALKRLGGIGALALGSKWLAGCGGSVTANPVPAGYRALSIDYSQRGAAIRSLRGIDGPPVPAISGSMNIPAGSSATANIFNPSGIDLTAAFQQLGVDFIRTHDLDALGTGDLDGIGVDRIFPDWTADPTLPASYNFTATDKVIAGIVASGAQVFFRLGRSDLSMVGLQNDNTPPADFAKFAQVATHIVMHYNQGWANGFTYNIRYWEVWNEPDLMPFWSGTGPQYCDLYKTVVTAIKSLDPTLKVGGPVLATHNDVRGTMNSFLAYVQQNALPLDFFSFHWYPQYVDPLDFYRLAVEYRALVNSYGYTSAELHLNEWNYSLYDTPTEDMHAAFVGSSLIYMQDAPLDRACCYSRTQPLIEADGTLTKGGSAFAAIGDMTSYSRIPVAGSDQNGFAVLAGVSADNKEIRVVISNYQIPAADLGPLPDGNELVIPNVLELTLLDRRSITYSNNLGYALNLTNLPWGTGSFTVQRFRIDAANNLTLVGTSTGQGATAQLTAALAPPSVEVIVVKPA
jgi:xylan 1,4-beta-xylosidase